MGVMRQSASRRVGRYEVLEYLGSGGMSDVYAALHTGLRKRVALKVLRTSSRSEREAVARFLREGECLARVRHPNVVEVHDVGIEEGVPYLVMELLHGETLDLKVAREGALPRDVALDFVLPIFEAVEQVHRAGVVHRDVKPANILLAQGVDGAITPKLVDFGVATLDERRLITGALGPIGTPAYMSPEQARGLDPVDARSDQYSLASMLFELLTGREPFPGTDVDGVLSSVARGRFPRLSEMVRGVPRGLDDVLARATAFDPRDRFGTVREFAEALLPYASRHVRETWQSRQSVPAEQSGAHVSGFSTRLAPRASMAVPRAPDAEATVRVRSLSAARAYAAPAARRKRQLLIAAIAAFALLLGLVVGVASSHGGLSLPAKVSALSHGDASQPELQPALPPPAPARVLRVSPARASTSLDGMHVGRGDVRLPETEGSALHELRVSAPGYVPRVVLFRGAPSDLYIALEPAP
jgi:tRNA A-37 threonylcarbamoyl transferase component Bud32